jgi:hypothetical protein
MTLVAMAAGGGSSGALAVIVKSSVLTQSGRPKMRSTGDPNACPTMTERKIPATS